MDDGRLLRIVVFPWLAFGHMMPYLELSKSLAKRGHRVSFVSTPSNVRRLRPSVPSHLSHLIDFVSLPLPPTQGLPSGAEATSDILPDEVQHLKKAFDGLRDPFSRFLNEALPPKPDWLVVDFAHYWAPEVASGLGIPCVLFSIFTAAFISFFGPVTELNTDDGQPRCTVEQLTRPRDWFTFPTSVAYRPHEARLLFDATYSVNASGVSDVVRYALTLEGCEAAAVRTCDEVESDWLALLRELHRKPFIPVGLLPPESGGATDDAAAESKAIFEWLDGQQSRSVVYVAFGSEAMLSAELVRELALGLELSDLPFLWALRRPASVAEDAEVLPEGFQERICGRGVVAMGWIPQLKVLAHASVGGFLTHCGWSSVIESLQHGHPLVLLPIFSDQGINTRVMEEKKIGLEVPRNEDGSFTKEAVSSALRLVVVEDEGETFRAKAKEMREVFGDKSRHESYVDGFVRYLKSSRKEKQQGYII